MSGEGNSMNCKHDADEVIASTLTEVSVFGAEVLFELHKCEECGVSWVQPYLSLGRLNIEDNMLIIKDEEILPSLEYIEKVLVIKHKNIPKELIDKLQTSEVKQT